MVLELNAPKSTPLSDRLLNVASVERVGSDSWSVRTVTDDSMMVVPDSFLSMRVYL